MKISRLESGEFLYEGMVPEAVFSYYKIMFEDNLIEKTINYYKAKVANLMGCSTPEYVSQIHRILKIEEQRLVLYFQGSKKKYIECIENETINLVAETIAKV